MADHTPFNRQGGRRERAGGRIDPRPDRVDMSRNGGADAVQRRRSDMARQQGRMKTPAPEMVAGGQAVEADPLRAVTYLRRSIELDPHNPELHCALGEAWLRLNRVEEAHASFKRALDLRPNHPRTIHNLGITHRIQGELDAAEGCARLTLHLDPGFIQGRNALGRIALGTGDYRRAEREFRGALADGLTHPAIYADLASALLAQKRAEEAVALLRQALKIDPDCGPALVGLGRAYAAMGWTRAAVDALEQAVKAMPEDPLTLSLLGILSQRLGRMTVAEVALEKALEAAPDSIETRIALGLMFRDTGRLDDAETQFRALLELVPDNTAALANLAHVLRLRGDLDGAVAAYRAAIDRQADLADAEAGLAIVLYQQGDHEEAIAAARRAIHHAPDHREARAALATVELATGALDDAWRLVDSPPLPADSPLLGFDPWDGTAPDDSWPLVIHGGGSLAADILFSRWMRGLDGRGVAGVLVDPALAPLIGRAFPDLPVVPASAPARPDRPLDIESGQRAALCELPRHRPAPPAGPWLVADREAVADWRRRLAAAGGLSVGIAWAGRWHHGHQQADSALDLLSSLASVPPHPPGLDQWLPVVRTTAVRFLNMETGLDPAALDRLRAASGGHIDDWPQASHDLADYLDRLAALDLLITVAGLPAHLAGAVGCPVWVLVPHPPEWCWHLDRTDSPWYPRMRLFRQGPSEDWSAVIDRVRVALGAWAAVRRP